MPSNIKITHLRSKDRGLKKNGGNIADKIVKCPLCGKIAKPIKHNPNWYYCVNPSCNKTAFEDKQFVGTVITRKSREGN